MNRKERRKKQKEQRKEAKRFKNSIAQTYKKPACHLHSSHTQEEIDNTKAKILSFLKSYDFKGSAYEADLETLTTIRKVYKEVSKISSGFVITLVKDHYVVKEDTQKLMTTDVYLVKHDDGWFIQYSDLPFSQNLITMITEMGIEAMINDNGAIASTNGYFIPDINKIVRQAFDSLTIKFENKWVA